MATTHNTPATHRASRASRTLRPRRPHGLQPTPAGAMAQLCGPCGNAACLALAALTGGARHHTAACQGAARALQARLG
jgi:hypothetical protein